MRDNPATAFHDDVNGVAERFVEPGNEVEYGLRFELQYVARNRDRVGPCCFAHGLYHSRASIADGCLRPRRRTRASRCLDAGI